MNTAAKARLIYLARKTTTGFSAAVNAKIEALAAQCMEEGERMEIDALTLNGQSLSGTTMSKFELLQVLLAVQKMIADGGAYSTRVTRVSFS